MNEGLAAPRPRAHQPTNISTGDRALQRVNGQVIVCRGPYPGGSALSEWFEDESFWEDLYPFLFPTERLSAAEREVEKILASVNLQSGSGLGLWCGRRGP